MPINIQQLKVTVLEDGRPIHKMKGSAKKVKRDVLSFFNSKY